MIASNPPIPVPVPTKWSFRAHSTSLLTWFFCALCFGPFLVYPVVQVLIGALSSVDYASGARTFTPSLLLLPLQNPIVRESLVNSAWLGLLATILASILAIPLAYAGARLKFWGKGWLTGMLLVPLLLPPLVGAVGLKQMLAREGFINTLLGRVQDPIDFLGSTTLGGWGPLLMVVLVSALHLYPLIYLNVSAAWANIDSSLEEAAENQGASGWRVFFTVTLPLLLPGYLSGALIVFIFAFTDLGTPLVFNYKRVAAVQIFDARTTQDPAGYVVALYLVVLSALIFWISRRFLDGGKISTLARGTRRAREAKPAPWAIPLLYGYFFAVIFAALLPHFGVILASFASDWTSRLWPAWTLDNYSRIFTDPTIPAAQAIKISILCATASMLIDVIGGFALAYALVRGKVWAKTFLDTLAMLPLALPGLILAFGLLISFRGTRLDPIDFSPIPLLIISYAVRRLPYALRSVSSGLQQMNVALEEASQNMGATPLQTVWQVTRPLVTANLIAAGLLTFAFAVLEVSDSLILASTNDVMPIAQAIYKMVQGAKLFPACALGVVGMLMLTAIFMLVNKLLGKQMGALFRA